MGNCYAGTSLFQEKVNLQDRDEVHNFLLDVLVIDGDLIENEDYFEIADDGGLLCEKLGYENDAQMHVAGIIEGKALDSPEQFEECFELVLNILDTQDYWGKCSYKILDNEDGTIIVAYIIGGEDR